MDLLAIGTPGASFTSGRWLVNVRTQALPESHVKGSVKSNHLLDALWKNRRKAPTQASALRNALRPRARRTAPRTKRADAAPARRLRGYFSSFCATLGHQKTSRAPVPHDRCSRPRHCRTAGRPITAGLPAARSAAP